MFFETYYLYRRLNSQKLKSEANPSRRLLRLTVQNVTESLYFICLILPFVALCKIFLAFEFSEILSPFFVFAYLIIIIRMNILFLTMINASFESFMRILLILTFLLPVIGFCQWEFSGISATWLSYFSPAWFQMEVLRSPTIPIFPLFIIWFVPIFVLLSIFLQREKRIVKQGRLQS